MKNKKVLNVLNVYRSLQKLEPYGYGLEPRGVVLVKGKGHMETWWVSVRRGAVRPAPLPVPADKHHPRSLASIVYTMMRKRIYTHPLDSVDFREIHFFLTTMTNYVFV